MLKDAVLFLLVTFLCTSGCSRSGVSPHALTTPKDVMPAVTPADKLYDICAQGNAIWVVGYFGAVVHSADGGKMWVRQNPKTTSGLLGVSFIDDRVGWVVGERGLILHSADGGTTWQKQVSPITTEDLFKVQGLSRKEALP